MNQRINILIVDDEPKNLSVLESILDDPAYRLVRAVSADEALLALVVEEFALLILDIRMPGMTGLELAQMIRDRKKTARVPIIFLTAYYSEDQHVLAGYGTGAVDYLHKPVPPAILRSKVAVFAELHRKNREVGQANRTLLAEVTERCRAEERLRDLNETLERRVAERTEALAMSNAALTETSERYRSLFEGSLDAIFSLGADGCFVSANPSALQLTGRTLEELRIVHFLDLCPPDQRRAAENAFRGAFCHRCLTMETTVLTATGERRELLISGAPAIVGGEVVGVSCIARDVTARKQAELQLTEAQAQLQRHAVNLEMTVAERTSELRTAVATLESEIAERQRLEREILEISEREQRRLGLELHDDLAQQLTGLEMFAFGLREDLAASAHPSATEAGHLMAGFNRALTTARHLSKSFFPVELEHGGLILAIKDLAHRTELLTKIRCEVKADSCFRIEPEAAIHLYRIVQESIGNALKHARAKHITIECRVREGVRTVRVCDDGVGFKQKPKADAWAGIGLHLLQYRARLLGATVEVKARSQGRGCQMTCRFAPASPDP